MHNTCVTLFLLKGYGKIIIFKKGNVSANTKGLRVYLYDTTRKNASLYTGNTAVLTYTQYQHTHILTTIFVSRFLFYLNGSH